MNIDIAESLLVSWLRHERKCQLVQTNWKAPSWGRADDKKIEERMQMAEEFLSKAKSNAKNFFSGYTSPLFGKQKLNQLIKQVEIDVLGAVWDSEGKFTKIIVGDVAHHSKGVNYYKGHSEVKVISKMLRTLAAIYAYWGNVEVEVFFAAPRVNPTPRKNICDSADKFSSFLKKNKLGEMKIDVALYLQDTFSEEIKGTVHQIISSKDYTNTAELYMRAYQLWGHDQDSLGNKSKIAEVEKDKAIGAFVRSELVKFLTNCNEELLEDLCSNEHIRKSLGLPFNLLIKEEILIEKSELRNRYYRTIIIDKGKKKYRLCNHWYPKNEKPLKKWMISEGWLGEQPTKTKA